MVNRIGGLASGMDIDSLVEKLMKAERAPLDKMFQKKQVYEWQRDAYRGVNAKLKAFDTFLFDKMILTGNLNKKTATSSNENLIKATATGSATGNLSIEGVSQLASSARGVGDQIGATGSTKLMDIPTIDGAPFKDGKLSLKAIGSDGKLAEQAIDIKVDGSMTVDDLVKSINDSGANVTALFESGRLSLTAKHSGDVKGSAEIVAEGADSAAILKNLGFSSKVDGTGITNLADNGKNAIFTVNGIATERSSNSFNISGYNVMLKETFNTGSVNTQMKEAAQKEYDLATAAKLSAQNALTDANDVLTDKTGTLNGLQTGYNSALNTTFPEITLSDKAKSAYDGLQNKAFFKDLTDAERSTIAAMDLTDPDAINNLPDSDSLKAKLLALKPSERVALNGSTVGDLENLAAKVTQDIEAANYSAVRNSLNGLSDDALMAIKGLDLTNISDAIQNISNPDVKAELEKLDENAIKQIANLGDVPRLQELRDFAAVDVPFQKAVSEKTAAEANVVAMQNKLDAAIQREGDANKALDYANALPTGDSGKAAVTLTASTDTQAMTEQIKEFVSKYNEMIEGFNGLLNEKKYRAFAPLTNVQREAMSENEQKLWDEKAKSGLLRSDSLLREGLAKMRSTFMSPVGGLGDKTIDSLAEIGITTSKNYTDGGKLVIDEKKLADAIAKDSDQVSKIFSQNITSDNKDVNGGNGLEDTRGIAKRLRDVMKDMTLNIEKTAGRATMTDQEYALGKKIVDSSKRMSNLESRLQDIETRYWRQFTAMERAINKANSQSSFFAQFKG